MHAVGYSTPGPIDRKDIFVDIDLPKPVPHGRDLLVEIRAVSVNPVDTKARKGVAPQGAPWRVLGFDAAGVVSAIGENVTRFLPGDEVFYAGALDRPGTNAEFHLVDERIVARKPSSLDFSEAAALPLTSITAYEALFDRIDVRRAVPGCANLVQIVGGAGGVGSIAIQLLRARSDATIVATASTAETTRWAREMGAHHVIDHRKAMAPQVAALKLGAPPFVFSTTHTSDHGPDIAETIAPQGRLAVIDDLADIWPFKTKSISIHWEYMFTRPVFGTADIARQGEILTDVARLADAGKIRTTLTQRLAPIDAATVTRAHAMVETGKTRGKIVLARA